MAAPATAHLPERRAEVFPIPLLIVLAIVFLILVAGILFPVYWEYEHSAGRLANPTTAPVAYDAAKLFEGYGRIITILVALLSIVAVFFGFFVRKSLYDTIADLRAELDRTTSSWKSEHDARMAQATAYLNEMAKMNAEMAEAVKKVPALEEALKAAAALTGNEEPPSVPATDSTRSAVDAQILGGGHQILAAKESK